MLPKFMQPENANALIFCTCEIVISIKDVQLSKQLGSIEVIRGGIEILTNDEHLCSSSN